LGYKKIGLKLDRRSKQRKKGNSAKKELYSQKQYNETSSNTTATKNTIILEHQFATNKG
jgi:hypothetical protein